MQSTAEYSRGKYSRDEADPHHDDLLDGRDDGIHERLELVFVAHKVDMAYTHEQDVSWQTWDQIHHHSSGLQV